MEFTQKQKRSLSRATQHIEDIRKGKHKEYCPLDIADLCKCYQELKDNMVTKTINENAVEVFANCDFNVSKNGMEWIVRL